MIQEVLPQHVPTSASIVIAVLVVVVLLGIVAAALRRRHERRLIGEILGERYEPHMSERSPDAPSTIEARKRADALGRSRHQWS